VLPGEEEEEGLQQAEEKGAERGTELTFGVRGVASEGDVEVPIEEASPPADDLGNCFFPWSYASSPKLFLSSVFAKVNYSGDSTF